MNIVNCCSLFLSHKGINTRLYVMKLYAAALACSSSSSFRESIHFFFRTLMCTYSFVKYSVEKYQMVSENSRHTFETAQTIVGVVVVVVSHPSSSWVERERE